MSGDEMTPDNAIVSQFSEGVSELSDEELDDVAGGFDLQFSVARFKKSTLGFAQETSPSSGCGGSAKSVFQSENIESALIQLVITDATTEDLKILGELFGDATAIEGSA
ncbi:MAG: hypothetical protein HC780_08565 [Leptolyngbyaceae cyanobacterium CSU_1_3]|nr:hypothetical protein [Leptolyngbyaceae cyanobacterium CSU_1_3]